MSNASRSITGGWPASGESALAPPAQLGLIGCGLRGAGYLHYLLRKHTGFQLVAAADPQINCAEFVSRTFAGSKAACVASGRELLKTPNLDGVIIASPNAFHCRDAVDAMERGHLMLLEKPVATSFEDLGTLWQAYQRSSSTVIIGFVLRYTPFYRRIEQIVRSGAIGKIFVINAEELMSDRLSMMFARGDWRPQADRSGGLLLEKCCHDIDVLNMLARSRVKWVASRAARTYLVPQPDAGPRCSECKIEPDCRFAKVSINKSFQIDWDPELDELFAKLDDDRCAFDERNSYPDHQTVNLEYANGVLCNFTVAQAQPATRRTIHIIGSEGRLYGNLEENLIKVYRRKGANDESEEVIRINHDGSGHGGGDSAIVNDFCDAINSHDNPHRPGLAEGIEAALICLAAEQSVRAGNGVEVDSIRQRVFGTAEKPK